MISSGSEAASCFGHLVTSDEMRPLKPIRSRSRSYSAKGLANSGILGRLTSSAPCLSGDCQRGVACVCIGVTHLTLDAGHRPRRRKGFIFPSSALRNIQTIARDRRDMIARCFDDLAGRILGPRFCFARN